ncbi:hypothetical protein SOASR029_18390 [Budvicia aquatica]|nr:hypothetical protein SOASR029_18390 [Budvicia aquatica]
MPNSAAARLKLVNLATTENVWRFSSEKIEFIYFDLAPVYQLIVESVSQINGKLPSDFQVAFNK